MILDRFGCMFRMVNSFDKYGYCLISNIYIYVLCCVDGLIEIGNEGSLLAFLSWKDSSPLPIQYFSFSTFTNVEAKWYYDCLREDGTMSNSKVFIIKYI